VTADVRGAFDNINQEQLLRLLRKLVTEAWRHISRMPLSVSTNIYIAWCPWPLLQEDYWVRKYVAITLSHGRLRRQFRRQAALTGVCAGERFMHRVVGAGSAVYAIPGLPRHSFKT
jgi:hypothetical protein